MQRQDWTLLAISFANGRGLSAVQLQKVLFLLEQGVPEEMSEPFYKFVPYNYGPFDAAVYKDAEWLASQNLVSISKPAGRYNLYNITPEGAIRAKQLEDEAPPRALKHLRNIVAWVQELSFAELLRAIYTRYPRMRANSVFSF